MNIIQFTMNIFAKVSKIQNKLLRVAVKLTVVFGLIAAYVVPQILLTKLLEHFMTVGYASLIGTFVPLFVVLYFLEEDK